MRSLLIGPVVAVALLATQAGAVRPPQLTDPKGDTELAAADILSATLSTVGRTLQIDLVVAAPVTDTMPYSYGVYFVAGDCNFSAVYYGHPAEPLGFNKSGVGCDTGSSSLPAGNVGVSGATITFTVPLSGPLRKGLQLTGIRADTTPSGLVSGAVLPYLQDTAITATTYTIGR